MRLAPPPVSPFCVLSCARTTPGRAAAMSRARTDRFEDAKRQREQRQLQRQFDVPRTYRIRKILGKVRKVARASSGR